MKKIELVCPAGHLPSLKAAVDNGADAVYVGFSNASNARNFPGLNFTEREIREGIEYAHRRGAKVFLTINTFPQGDDMAEWYEAVDKGQEMGVDAQVIANIGVLDYARNKYPDMRIHLSVQAGASTCEAISFYKKHFGIERLILPRVLTIDEVRAVKEKTDVEVEVFALGLLCINYEGECYLSSYLTGESTNTCGACSPAEYVNFDEGPDKLRVTSNGVLINEYDPGEVASYPIACKGRYVTGDAALLDYPMEDLSSLNVLDLIPQLADAGIDALKIEGRQRTRAYVGTVARVFREAIDVYHSNPQGYQVKKQWREDLTALFEGTKQTYSCYVEK
ncbi:MAG: U32 family peptidase [Nitrospirota bacterium]|nr:U32 family peptidase [Nitrospirota bacterium]